MSRDKGKRGEREVAALLRKHGYEGRRTSQANGEIEADVVGLPGIHIEVKRTEALRLYDALAQSEHDKHGDDISVVFHRKNDSKWVCILFADDFMDIYKEWEASDPVVRCCSCKHHDHDGADGFCNYFGKHTRMSDYCSYGCK